VPFAGDDLLLPPAAAQPRSAGHLWTQEQMCSRGTGRIGGLGEPTTSLAHSYLLKTHTHIYRSWIKELDHWIKGPVPCDIPA
jgi:hypothetical protein